MWKRKASLPGRRPCNMLQRAGWQVRRVLGDWKRSILATWEVLQPANPRACRHQRIAQPHVIVRAKHSEQADRVWRQNDAFDCSFHCIAKKGTLDISWFAKGSVINTSIYEVGGTKASQIFSTTSCPYPFLYMAQLTWAPKHDVRHHEIEGRKLRPVACDRETEVQQDWNSSETMGTTGLDWTDRIFEVFSKWLPIPSWDKHLNLDYFRLFQIVFLQKTCPWISRCGFLLGRKFPGYESHCCPWCPPDASLFVQWGCCMDLLQKGTCFGKSFVSHEAFHRNNGVLDWNKKIGSHVVAAHTRFRV